MFKWLFGKKAIPEIKPNKKIIYEVVQVDIGRTQVRVRFTNGKTFKFWIYGNVGQHVNYSNFIVGLMVVDTSLLRTQTLLNSSFHAPKSYFTDDSRNPKQFIIGIVERYTILETESYIETFSKAILVEET